MRVRLNSQRDTLEIFRRLTSVVTGVHPYSVYTR